MYHEVEDTLVGRALSSGDFNGDGCDDLAIGTPDEGIESVHGAGAVNILYCNSTDGGQSWQLTTARCSGRKCSWTLKAILCLHPLPAMESEAKAGRPQ
ncbi:FG-GAP repeat protein [Thiolapillus sp.]|uniref:FG-GAP repeat protein n=1 Tax=Thiolapillus sp. TaxID=2017437 RepID=UPI0025D9A3D4